MTERPSRSRIVIVADILSFAWAPINVALAVSVLSILQRDAELQARYGVAGAPVLLGWGLVVVELALAAAGILCGIRLLSRSSSSRRLGLVSATGGVLCSMLWVLFLGIYSLGIAPLMLASYAYVLVASWRRA